MLININKANFNDFRVIPAGKYAAKQQIKCSALGVANDFYLSSETVDLSQIPLLEPVAFSANVERMGGGKGFFVLSINQLSVTPFIQPSKK